jgi:hypothetical protein
MERKQRVFRKLSENERAAYGGGAEGCIDGGDMSSRPWGQSNDASKKTFEGSWMAGREEGMRRPGWNRVGSRPARGGRRRSGRKTDTMERMQGRSGGGRRDKAEVWAQ